MLVVGKTDAFEQGYMARFEKIASDHGVFVKYEKDRAARDIGLHLTKALKSGQRLVTNSLVWFQMKGIMATTMPKGAFDACDTVDLSMDVEHLRHWFLDSEPTHLVVYVESVDQFLVMNLQAYVTATWGRDILTLDQKTATVKVPKSSTLDKQAFSILLRFSEVAQWVKALDSTQEDALLLHRDHSVIYAVGTAHSRAMKCGVSWTKWLSKMRHELSVVQRPVDFVGANDEGWDLIRDHWQYGGIDPESGYPYLELSALDEDWWDDPDDDDEVYTLRNGSQVYGPNCSYEYCLFMFGAELNAYGKTLFSHIETLVKIGLLELRSLDEDGHGYISIAPWHGREV